MKRADIDTLLVDSMISTTQHATIVDRYWLDGTESIAGSKLGGIFAMIGAALCVAGIALVISSNWALIPRLVKVASAILLLLAFHGGGVLCTGRNYARVGAALHVAGSVMFLLSIALIGQVYNLSSRPPNAILLWSIGICLLPWVLKSRAQFFLLLIALVTWLVLESDARDSWLYIRMNHDYVPVMSWIGALLLGFSAGIAFMPQRWRGEHFDVSAEVVGAVIVSLGLLSCVLGWYGSGFQRAGGTPLEALHSLPVWLTVVALTWVTARSLSDQGSPPLGRVAWFAGVAAAIVVPWALVAFPALTSVSDGWKKNGPFIWLASATLFCFALVLIQRGIARSSRALINAGIGFVAANIIAVYFRLFSNMMNTGITFVATGALLVLLAWQMERWRRRLSLRVDAQTAGARHES